MYCFKCAGIDKSKGISSEAINMVMESLLKSQKNHAERLKSNNV